MQSREAQFDSSVTRP
nr:unnamed protein product [Callosobruchus chinensis]